MPWVSHPESRGCWAARDRRLTVIVDEERGVGCKDLVVADLAVLRGAVPINGFHA